MKNKIPPSHKADIAGIIYKHAPPESRRWMIGLLEKQPIALAFDKITKGYQERDKIRVGIWALGYCYLVSHFGGKFLADEEQKTRYKSRTEQLRKYLEGFVSAFQQGDRSDILSSLAGCHEPSVRMSDDDILNSLDIIRKALDAEISEGILYPLGEGLKRQDKTGRPINPKHYLLVGHLDPLSLFLLPPKKMRLPKGSIRKDEFIALFCEGTFGGEWNSYKVRHILRELKKRGWPDPGIYTTSWPMPPFYIPLPEQGG